MGNTGRPGTVENALDKQAPDVGRLNLQDRHEVEALRAALNCRVTDLYAAVAMVGDMVDDIRRYIIKTIERRQAVREDAVSDVLPPLWPPPADWERR